MKLNVGLCVLILLVCGVSVAQIAAQPNSRQETQKVDFESLASGNAQVIGKLRKPVGTVVRMLCRIDFDKSGNISKIAGANDYLHVLAIDGIAIPKDKQPTFSVASVRTMESDSAIQAQIRSAEPFECNGYESIMTDGIPNELKTTPVYAASGPWNYYSSLEIYSDKSSTIAPVELRK